MVSFEAQKFLILIFFLVTVFWYYLSIFRFPHSSVSKESVCNAGDLGLIPGFERFPGEANGNPL